MIVIVEFMAAVGLFYAVRSITGDRFIWGWLGGAFCMQMVQWISEAAK